METTPELIYCGSGNKLDDIAVDNGFLFGLRLPNRNKVPYPLHFADQDWKDPDKEKYLKDLHRRKPRMATVIDIERPEQLEEALEWANEVTEVVEKVILIPKCHGVIEKIPRQINNKEVLLGYSVPTRYGKTDLLPEEFDGWKVHLLGGTPHGQIQYAKEMNVVSLDCNYHALKATKFGEYWTGKINDTRWWRRYEGTDDRYENTLLAFNESCKNIYSHWYK